ncbi:MAG: succinate dehydrogenase, cytochrome b556 subunit [Steroidobacteraceae bacterium]
MARFHRTCRSTASPTRWRCRYCIAPPACCWRPASSCWWCSSPVSREASTVSRPSAFAASIGGRLLIAAFLIGFCYHLANGIRHLTWDMGFGMERAQARRSGALVVALTVLGAAVVLWKLFASGVAS